MRRLGLVVAVALLGSSCVFSSGRSGPADELAELAAKVDEATYAAVYRFAFTRQNAPGQTTRMSITQQPPITVRKVEEMTRPAEGKPVTLTAWYIHNSDGDFACNEFPSLGVRCQRNPIARTFFGSEKLDVFFDAPADRGGFADVRRLPRAVRIKGQKGTCFEAVPVAPSPEAASPEPPAERYRYELCYAEDGILLSGKRTSLDDTGGATDAESFVEVISISRVVDPRELRLPGALVDPADLPK